MVDEARQQKELLVNHRLVEDMLQTLGQSLDEYDLVVERGAEGRRIHIGAAANLEAVSDEVVQIVRGLDGYNRYRFTAQPDLLAAWTAASNIIGPPASGGRAETPRRPHHRPAVRLSQRHDDENVPR